MVAQPSVGCRHHHASLASYALWRATAQQHDDRVACVVAFGQYTEADDWLRVAAIEIITEMEVVEGTTDRAIRS